MVREVASKCKIKYRIIWLNSVFNPNFPSKAFPIILFLFIEFHTVSYLNKRKKLICIGQGDDEWILQSHGLQKSRSSWILELDLKKKNVFGSGYRLCIPKNKFMDLDIYRFGYHFSVKFQIWYLGSDTSIRSSLDLSNQ
jgi:hypothetical protein